MKGERVFVTGCALVIAGVAWLSPPAGVITAGCICILTGLGLTVQAASRGKKKPTAASTEPATEG
jgi:hypothetical protein